jgi:hypothetical protein
MYRYIDTQTTDGHTDRKAGRQTDRQTARQKDKQKDAQETIYTVKGTVRQELSYGLMYMYRSVFSKLVTSSKLYCLKINFHGFVFQK